MKMVESKKEIKVIDIIFDQEDVVFFNETFCPKENIALCEDFLCEQRITSPSGKEELRRYNLTIKI